MKKFYSIIILSFICLGLQAQSASPPVKDVPPPAIDPFVATVPGSTANAGVKGEPQPAAQPIVDGYMAGDGLKADDVSIVTVTMSPELNINVFGTFSAAVQLEHNETVTINDVTLNTRNVIKTGETVQELNWNYYTNGTASTNVSIEKINPTIAGKTYTFSGIRPDDIYPEIHFVTSDVTHNINNTPSNALTNQDNIQLMHFQNPFTIPANTSFFIEFYAEPNDPGAPPPQPLEVYLVGSGKASSFFATDDTWKTDAVLVGTIDRDAVFDHQHPDPNNEDQFNSKHHLVRLSASAENTVQGKDISGDFWIVLSSPTSDSRRSWNLKYHDGYVNNGTWHQRNSNGTVTAQTGCPDAHVHFARDSNLSTMDGLKHTVEVSYTKGGTPQTPLTDVTYIYFGEIDRLAPNPTSFTGPGPGSYQDNVEISWNQATDPNNNPVTYSLSLVDVDNGTLLLENFASGLSSPSYSFNTAQFVTDNTTLGNGSYNVLAKACDVDLCTDFYLYDIYGGETGTEEEFVIANIFKWAGTTPAWDTFSNWTSQNGYVYQAVFPKLNDGVVVPGALATWPVISGITATPKSLEIQDGAQVTIGSTGRLTITEGLNNLAGASGLIVEAGGSLIHNTTGQQATIKPDIPSGNWPAKSGTDVWHLLSSPVAAQVISAFIPATGGYDFYGWSEADDLWINRKESAGDSPLFSTWNGTDFIVGRGYLVSYQNTQTFEFAGGVNVSDAAKTGLTKSGAGVNGLYETGWHLLGNPFASELNWGDASWVPTNIAATAKIWSNGGYIDVQTDIKPEIPAHQGFFVQVTEATGSITIPAAARQHASIAEKQNEVPHILMTASATDSGLRQRSVVRIDPANGSDYNAIFLAGNAPQLYAMPAETPLSTIALEEITDDTVIPYVFIKNNEGSEFQIALEKTMEDKNLYLLDMVANVEHHLTFQEPYVFTSSASNPKERFELRFTPNSEPTAVDPPKESRDDANIYVTDGVLHMEFTKTLENAKLQLVDALGREVLNNNLGNGNYFSAPVYLKTGTYIVRIISRDHLITEKVFIR